MTPKFQSAPDELRPAYFSERLAAFTIDGLLFYGLFLLSLKLADGRYASWKAFLDNAYWSVELK